jgi:hypothetical protein
MRNRVGNTELTENQTAHGHARNREILSVLDIEALGVIYLRQRMPDQPQHRMLVNTGKGMSCVIAA